MNSLFDFSAVFSWGSKGLVQAGMGKHNKGLSFQLPLPASRLLFLPEVLAAVIHNVSERYLCAASSSSPPAAPTCVLPYSAHSCVLMSCLTNSHHHSPLGQMPLHVHPTPLYPKAHAMPHVALPKLLWGHALPAHLSPWPNTLYVQPTDVCSHADVFYHVYTLYVPPIDTHDSRTCSLSGISHQAWTRPHPFPCTHILLM